MTAAPAWITHHPIAHRGLHNEQAPENSIAAFEAARDAGLPIELDVHASVDGEPVVFHDDTLERMTRESGRLCAMPWHRLRLCRLGGTSQTMPHLAEVLACVDGQVPVVIEVKNAGRVGVIERSVLRILTRYSGAVAVQSFNPFSLAWFRKHAPEISRGLLAGDLEDAELWRPKKFVLRRLLLAPAVRPSYIGYDLRALPYWSASLARRSGLPLLAWTVRTESDRALAEQLADNYIFEGIEPRLRGPAAAANRSQQSQEL